MYRFSFNDSHRSPIRHREIQKLEAWLKRLLLCLLLSSTSLISAQSVATLESAGYSAPGAPIPVAPGQVAALFFRDVGPLADGGLCMGQGKRFLANSTWRTFRAHRSFAGEAPDILRASEERLHRRPDELGVPSHIDRSASALWSPADNGTRARRGRARQPGLPFNPGQRQRAGDQVVRLDVGYQLGELLHAPCFSRCREYGQ